MQKGGGIHSIILVRLPLGYLRFETIRLSSRLDGAAKKTSRLLAKVLLHLLLVAALALPAHSAGAASRDRKVKPQPATSDRSPLQDLDSYYVPNLIDGAGNSAPIMQVPGGVVVFPGK